MKGLMTVVEKEKKRVTKGNVNV